MTETEPRARAAYGGRKREAAVERWLREEVAPAFDAMKADPEWAIPAEAVFAEVRARHATRSKSHS